MPIGRRKGIPSAWLYNSIEKNSAQNNILWGDEGGE